jgi:hypothetical protein
MKLAKIDSNGLISSAFLKKNQGVYSLLVNCKDRWPFWSDVGTTALHADAFPLQIAAIKIEESNDLYDAVLVVYAETVEEYEAFNAEFHILYSAVEKDQIMIIWIPATRDDETSLVACIY